MTTVMAICAEKGNFDMPKSEARIIKIMSENPRKIHQINIEINFEENHLTDIQKRKLISVGKNCPVARSLDKDIIQDIKFNF